MFVEFCKALEPEGPNISICSAVQREQGCSKSRRGDAVIPPADAPLLPAQMVDPRLEKPLSFLMASPKKGELQLQAGKGGHCFSERLGDGEDKWPLVCLSIPWACQSSWAKWTFPIIQMWALS